MQRNIMLALAMITIGAASSQAAAETVTLTSTAGPSLTISTADLNLDSPQGIAGLEHRIRSAAANLCQTNAVEPVNIRMARAKCYRTAISDGYRQLDRMTAANSAASMGLAAVILTKTGR